ncbi:uncharacterized protein LOC123541422 isoform X1 [Mercenaria mercenaria]|uniref:uncharacterized protein LOC123541422 isoform X1 n=1 Tax=Mercenaria mercenaria TaxID=6596 RepID=UPI00234F2779|nr:uncharacterized protein LOC123541422 isoform X1 [Mercenaria mercenaria]
MGSASSSSYSGQREKKTSSKVPETESFNEEDGSFNEEDDAETIEKIIERSLDRLKSAWNSIAKIKGNNTSSISVSDAKREIQYILDVYDKFSDELSRRKLRDYRNDVAELILETHMFDFFKSVVEKYRCEDIKPEKIGEESRMFFMCLSVLFRYSDDSDTMAIEVAKTKVLETCKKVLEICVKSHIEKKLQRIGEDIAFMCHGIVYHVSMRGTNIERLRNLGFINVLLPYLKSHKDIVKIPCLATLANIVNEEECDIIKTNIRSVSRLLDVMAEGLNKPDRTYEGWSCKECAIAIRKLARNDANKQILWELDVIPLLVRFSQISEEDEKIEGVLSIWTLAFSKDIRKAITADRDLGVVDLLLDLKKQENTELKNACERCLWTLKDELKASPVKEYNESVMAIQWQPSSEVNEKNEGHIMISYQSAHRDVLIKIKDILKEQNYKVWMDVDQMGGSTLQAMANAVENASIVLLCYSRNYKDSQYCQSEAEYAYNQRKPIIPLKMEQGYKPDGWLGILLGEKYFVEFSGKYDFNDKVKDLFKEIRGTLAQTSLKTSKALSLKGNETFLSIQHEEVYTPVANTIRNPDNVNMMKKIRLTRQWTEDDVSNWLTKYGLQNQGIDDITGEEISLLAKMHVEAPERMYKCIKRELELTSLLARSRLVWALYELAK